MINKILISVIVSAEVLTLFPLLLLGIYSLVNSAEIKDLDTASLLGTVALAIGYVTAVLLGAFKAIQNLSRPLKAYLFLSLPLIIIGAVLFWRSLS